MSKTFQVRMAKPSEKDIGAAEDLMNVLNIIDGSNSNWHCAQFDDVPDLFDLHDNDEFDEDRLSHLKSLFNKLSKLLYDNPNFHGRVISGMCHVIMYDKNKIIDPDSDTIDLHPRFQETHDDLVRETQAARYWNKRYHEMVDVVERKDRAFAMLAIMMENRSAQQDSCPIYDKDENLIAVGAGYKSPAVGFKINQNNQPGENHEE